jgi:hypothetical protein
MGWGWASGDRLCTISGSSRGCIERHRVWNGAKKREKVEEKNARIAKAHRQYADAAEAYLGKAQWTVDFPLTTHRLNVITYDTIKYYMRHAVRQIDQIRRRVLDGQKELGLRVCVMEDQYGFFLNHLVVRKSMDVDVVPFVQAAKERFPHLVEMDSCSQTVLSDESYTLGESITRESPRVTMPATPTPSFCFTTACMPAVPSPPLPSSTHARSWITACRDTTSCCLCIAGWSIGFHKPGDMEFAV